MTLREWFGLKKKFDYSRARPLGPVLFVFISICSIGLAGLVLIRFGEALFASSTFGDDNPAHEAVRNIGLVLAALVGLPFIVWRSYVAQRQTDIAHSGQVTDRINKAVENLGAEKVVHRQRRREKSGKLAYRKNANGTPDFDEPIFETVSLPNIEVRIGAIHALARIARDDLNFHVEIMEILCAYIRHNAPLRDDLPAFPAPEEDEQRWPRWHELNDWKKQLPKIGDDIQTALYAIGSRTDAQLQMEAAHQGPTGFYRADLRNTCLVNADLQKLDLNEARLNNTQLHGADVSGGQLQAAHLRNVQLHGADLRGAQLQGVELRGAQLQGADLLGAQLQRTNFTGASLKGTNFFAADLSAVIINAVTLERANFEQTKISGAIIHCEDLRETVFKDACLENVRFDRCKLRNCYFGGAVLTDVGFVDTQITSVSFEHARMSGTTFNSTSLEDCDFERAHLSNARVENCTLRGIRLEGTPIDGASFYRCDVDGVFVHPAHAINPSSFAKSRLRNIDLSKLRNPEILTEAIGDKSVVLPEGWIAGQGPLQHWTNQIMDDQMMEERWEKWRSGLL